MPNNNFRCPYRCHDKNYPAPKWKTEKGYLKHLETCIKNPDNIKKKKEEFNIVLEKFNEIKNDFLLNFPYKIGQKIYYVREYIIKPTHVQRGNRQVRVRYEAEKRFEANESIINSIDVNFNGVIPKDISSNVIINGFVKLNMICDNMNAAIEKAKLDNDSYKEYCNFASFCR